jgi:hypothetical protein
MKLEIIILVLFITGLSVGVADGFTYWPENYIYHTVFYLDENNPQVHLWVVEDWSEIPICSAAKGIPVYGCSRYFKSAYQYDYMYLVINEKTPEFDVYGLTFFQHEAKHIICGCNWHS